MKLSVLGNGREKADITDTHNALGELLILKRAGILLEAISRHGRHQLGLQLLVDRHSGD